MFKNSLTGSRENLKKAVLISVVKYAAASVVMLLLLAAFSVFGRHIEVFGIKPNIAFALCAAFAVSMNPVAGMSFSIAVGIFYDWLGGGALGFHSLLFMAVVFAASNLFAKYFRRTFFGKLAVSFICVFVFSLVSWLLTSYMFGGTEFVFGLTRIVLPETLYSALTLPLLVPLFSPLQKKELR